MDLLYFVIIDCVEVLFRLNWLKLNSLCEIIYCYFCSCFLVGWWGYSCLFSFLLYWAMILGWAYFKCSGAISLRASLTSTWLFKCAGKGPLSGLVWPVVWFLAPYSEPLALILFMLIEADCFTLGFEKELLANNCYYLLPLMISGKGAALIIGITSTEALRYLWLLSLLK